MKFDCYFNKIIDSIFEFIVELRASVSSDFEFPFLNISIIWGRV